MKKVLALALVLVVGTAFAGPSPKATGGGTVDWPSGRVTYGFNAQQVDVSGEAKGQAQIHHRDAGFSVHGDVLYMAFDPVTGEAWIGGVVTQTSDPAYEGMEFNFQVLDGGEGANATGPDMVSSVVYGLGVAVDALSMPAYFLREWDNGNVQVK
jgi:hypothetical protein